MRFTLTLSILLSSLLSLSAQPFNPDSAYVNARSCIVCDAYAVADTFSLDSGQTWYTVVDKTELINRRNQGADLTKVCVSLITDLSYMFSGQSDFNQDITSWDVSNVTNFTGMFQSDTAFNQPIGNWDMSSATSISSMFSQAKRFNQPIGSWDISGVVYAGLVFSGARDFNQDLSQWPTSQFVSMYRLFAFTDNFNQDLSSWDVSNVTDFESAFRYALAFDQDLSSWDVSSGTDMSRMFENATSFNQDIGGWDVRHVTNMNYMFYNASSFDQDLREWCVSYFNSEPYYFSRNSGFTPINIPNWGSCYNPNIGFVNSRGCIECDLYMPGDSFSMDLGNTWYNVVNRNELEQRRDALSDLSYVCVSKVTNFSGLFENNTYFNGDITNWDVSNATQMQGMFNGAQNFNQDISNWDVSAVNNMAWMFSGATSFNRDIGNWDVGNVNNMVSMFNNAFSFNQPIGDWDISNVWNMMYMFSHALSFNQPIGDWDVSSVTNMMYLFDNAISFDQDLRQWCVPQFSSAPFRFAWFSNMDTNFYPVWGTCPCPEELGIQEDSIFACGASYSLEGPEGFTEYLWNTGDTSRVIQVSNSGRYSLFMKNAECQLDDTVYVNLLESSISATDSSSCNASPVIVGGEVNGKTARIRFVGIRGSGFTSDICLDDIQLPGAPLADFESEVVPSISGSFGYLLLNGWTIYPSSNRQMGWETEGAEGVNENSSGTGPFYDNTNFGQTGGKYIYLETSSGSIGNEANVEGPEFTIDPVNSELSFFYHMYGNLMGGLRVELDLGDGFFEVWSRAGSDQLSGADPWTQVVIDLNSFIGRQITNSLNGPVKKKYLWSTGDTTSNILVTPSATTTYYRTTTDGLSSCLDSFTVHSVQASAGILDSIGIINANQGTYKAYFTNLSGTHRVEFREVGDTVWKTKTIRANRLGSQQFNITPLFGKEVEISLGTLLNGNWERGCPLYFQTECKSMIVQMVEQRQAFCKDDSVLVRAGVAGGYGAKTYSWSNGATTKRTYAQQGEKLFVTVTDAAGCSLQDSITASSIESASAPDGFQISRSGAVITGSWNAVTPSAGQSLVGYRMSYRLRNTQQWTNTAFINSTSQTLDWTGSGIPAGNYEFVVFARYQETDTVYNSNFSCIDILGYNGIGGKKDFDTTHEILISVFPNPTHGIFTLKAPIDSGFYLRDVHGKEILKGTMNEGQMELNISELSQGIYSLEVHHLDGVYNYKVVKK